jgi:hypothetical protein
MSSLLQVDVHNILRVTATTQTTPMRKQQTSPRSGQTLPRPGSLISVVSETSFDNLLLRVHKHKQHNWHLP